MPRPKRSKIAPSAPAALPAKLLASLKAADSSSSASQKSSNSDDSDGLVKRVPVDRNSRHKKHEVFMTSALPVEERNRRWESRATRTALTEIARNADFANRKKERARKLEEGLDAPDTELLVPSSLPNTKRTAHAQKRQPAPNTPKTHQKPISQTSAMPSANWRAQATPRLDSSILALGNFKRRSRQPSLLGIGRPDDSPSLSNFDLGEDISFGEPELPEASKVLSSRQRAQDQPKDTTAQGNTVLSASRHIPTLSSGSRKRKRTPEILVRRSQSPTTSETDRIFGSDQTSPRPLVSIEHDETPEPQLPPPNRATTPQEVWSDTMAPPQSSSPSHGNATQEDPDPVFLPSSPEKGKYEKLGRGKRLAPTAVKVAPKTKPKGKKSKTSEPLSTAALQSLLPRRRTQHHNQAEDEFGVPGSDHEPEMTAPQDDEDELSFMPMPKRKVSGKAKKNANHLTTKKSIASKTLSRPLNPVPTAKSKSKAKPKSTITKIAHLSSSSLSSPPPSPTHSNSGSDAVVEPGPDTSIGSLPAKGQKELKSLARKFKEVDRWEMEFEVITASSSSPRDGR